jgi:protochlorophyllide reductase
MARRTAVLSTLAGLTATVLPRSARAAPADVEAPDANAADAPPPAPARRPRKRVLVTGPNSGIGFDGACKLAALGYDVVLACRTLAKAEDAAARIRARALENGAPLSGELIPAECDLGDLGSVRRFAASAAGAAPLDALVLNAGVQYSGDNDVRRTADGFEITVGTNHLGHFLLTELMLPRLEQAAGTSPDGTAPRVVVTASEVHDPASPGGNVGLGAGLGDLAGLKASGADFAMLDGSAYNADKAYKDSKLCNVLFARELQRRLSAANSAVTVNAFGPGLITRTGFFRYQNPLFVKLFDFATNDIFHVAETVDGGGDCLVYMATSPALEGKGGLYYNNGIAPGEGKTGHKFERGEVSAEARDDAEAAALWQYSERLVGMSA